MIWQDALLNYSSTHNNFLSIDKDIPKSSFNDIKRALKVFRAKWHGGKKQCFELALPACECINHLLSLDSMPKVNPHSYHPTPKVMLSSIFEHTAANPDEWGHLKERPIEILEPSCGEGAILDEVKRQFTKAGISFNITCIELDPINAIRLRSKGYSPIVTDFLKFNTEKKFDLILINPPFESINFIKHIRKAQKLLNKDGYLVGVVPTKPIITSSQKLVEDFRDDIGLTLDDAMVFEPGVFETAKHTETRLVQLESVERMNMLRQLDSINEHSIEQIELSVFNDSQTLQRVKAAGKSLESLRGAISSNVDSLRYIHNAYLPDQNINKFIRTRLM